MKDLAYNLLKILQGMCVISIDQQWLDGIKMSTSVLFSTLTTLFIVARILRRYTEFVINKHCKDLQTLYNSQDFHETYPTIFKIIKKLI